MRECEDARSARRPTDRSCATGVAAILCLLLALTYRTPGRAQAADPGPDAQVYLQQLQPILAEAESGLNDLQYYLPLASINDPNDPTWGLAQQASEAVRGDADLLETLSPPDVLASANDALIVALRGAATSADDAIDALSLGDEADGRARLADFRDDLSALARAEATLPAATQPSPATP